MKINNKITVALMALGLVSVASMANASTTYTDTGNVLGGGANVVYQEVYVTGSTAFRNNIEAILAATAANNGFFTGTGPTKTYGGGGSSKAMYAGIINDGSGTPFIVNCDFTGSEAGLSSLHSAAVTYAPDHSLAGAPAGNVNLPSTPSPAAFTNPTSGAANVVAVPDLALSDTSKAVSYSAGTALTAFGNVAIIPFEWVKGNYNNAGAKSTSWTDLANIATWQLPYFLPAGSEVANYFTGKSADTQHVYLLGRNSGSGTRANATCEAGLLPPASFNQYVPPGCTYVADATGNPVLTYNNGVWAAGLPHSLGLGFEGWDSGATVAATLGVDSSPGPFVTLGYVGLSDATTALGLHAATVTLDGQAENDGNVINGSYPFWGYENLYGQVTPTGDANQAANLLVTQIGAIFAAETWPDANQDTAIDPNAMNCAKPGSGDTGYPSQ